MSKLIYTAITIQQAQQMIPAKRHHEKYWRVKISKCSLLQNIFLIQTNNGKEKNRVIMTEECDLIDSKTGIPISQEVELEIKYMLKFTAHDMNGNCIKVTLWNAFSNIIKKSAKCELEKLRNLHSNVKVIFATYLEILNASSWIATIQSNVTEFKGNNDNKDKVIYFDILKMEEFHEEFHK